MDTTKTVLTLKDLVIAGIMPPNFFCFVGPNFFMRWSLCRRFYVFGRQA